MAMKLSGAEFNAFLNDKTIWPNEDDWLEDELISIDGGESDGLPGQISDSAVVVVYGGTIRRHDKDDDALLTMIRKWRGLQTTTFLIVRVNKNKEEALRAAIKAAGGKITT